MKCRLGNYFIEEEFYIKGFFFFIDVWFGRRVEGRGGDGVEYSICVQVKVFSKEVFEWRSLGQEGRYGCENYAYEGLWGRRS